MLLVRARAINDQKLTRITLNRMYVVTYTGFGHEHTIIAVLRGCWVKPNAPERPARPGRQQGCFAGRANDVGDECRLGE